MAKEERKRCKEVDMMMLFEEGVVAGDEEEDDGVEEKGDTGGIGMQTSVDCN